MIGTDGIPAVLKESEGLLGDLAGLSLFAGLKEHPLLVALGELLEAARGAALIAGEESPHPAAPGDAGYWGMLRAWAAFTAAFARTSRDYSWYGTIAHLTRFDDNPFTQAAESKEGPPAFLAALAKTDLSRLGRIAVFTPHRLGLALADRLRNAGLEERSQDIEEEARLIQAAESKEAPGELRGMFPKNTGWGAAMPALIAGIHAQGAGLLGQYHVFSWTALGMKPVENPDPIRLSKLWGYEEQRSIVIANTLRFVEGGLTNNLLLYGDRGTGKSATVKAVCNEYAGRGLKLLELNKANLAELPQILATLRRRSRRFIIFIDDLSFESADDAFRNLKALLEGGVEARPDNTAIYATSNRRHLVKEPLADRPSAAMAATAAATGDLRAFDTMQEQFSLADRFGLTVVYTAPSQEEYLDIAEHIAAERGLLPPNAEARQRFRSNALRWERWFNGRSPRTAVQYVDWIGGTGTEALRFPWE